MRTNIFSMNAGLNISPLREGLGWGRKETWQFWVATALTAFNDNAGTIFTVLRQTKPQES
jgi:hypothetical protein